MALSPNPGDYEFTNFGLGEIQNYLGILSPDDWRYFFPKALLEICPNVSDLAHYLGIQRTQLYQEKVSLKKDDKRIIHLVIASDIVYILLKKDRQKTVRWLCTPNIKLFGDSPFEAIMRGEGEVLIAWLKQRAGIAPGQAF